MTKINDIQINAEGATLLTDDVPGVGQLSVQLDRNGLDTLTQLAVDASSAARGYTLVSGFACDVEVGDVVMGHEVTHVRPLVGGRWSKFFLGEAGGIGGSIELHIDTPVLFERKIQ